jgi:hypothetical protein
MLDFSSALHALHYTLLHKTAYSSHLFLLDSPTTCLSRYVHVTPAEVRPRAGLLSSGMPDYRR